MIINDEERGGVHLPVDTGAGATSYKDAVRLSLAKLAKKRPKRKVVGVSGVTSERILQDKIELIIFDHEGNSIKLSMKAINIATEPPPGGPDFNLALQRPSILGWNALKELKIEVALSRRCLDCVEASQRRARLLTFLTARLAKHRDKCFHIWLSR